VVPAKSYRRRGGGGRDRHGRGLRGPLYPSSLPAATTRAERFDSVVLDALEPIEARWRSELTKLDVAVDDVPEIGTGGEEKDPPGEVLADGGVPLARLVPAKTDRGGAATSARIVLYRRPLEARAKNSVDLAELVHDVLVEQGANYLCVDPSVIDGEG
jgi:predicted Zn-dependent protease with MMP-like domain